MRALLHLVLAVLLAWLLWISCQYAMKASTAAWLLDRTMAEISAMGLPQLQERLGQEAERTTVEHNGRRYWISWMVLPPRAQMVASSRPTADTAYVETNIVEARILVDYLELVPFTSLRTGPSAQLTLTTQTKRPDSIRRQRSN